MPRKVNGGLEMGRALDRMSKWALSGAAEMLELRGYAHTFQRDIDRSIVLHGCPSMLMLGADLRTRFHHHREGQPPPRNEG